MASMKQTVSDRDLEKQMVKNYMAGRINSLAHSESPWDEDVQWIFTLHAATAKGMDIKQVRPSATWSSADLEEFAVLNMRNLVPENMEYAYTCPYDGIVPIARIHLFYTQKPPINEPSDTMISMQFIETIASNKKLLTLSGTGDAFNDKQQYAPGHVHFRDIVLYRIIEGAMKSQGITNIRIITNPALFASSSMAASNAKRELKVDLCYCANMNCMALGSSHKRCAGCSVAYYCSADCQKKDWVTKHKAECKRHTEMHRSIPSQEYFDAIIARDD